MSRITYSFKEVTRRMSTKRIVMAVVLLVAVCLMSALMPVEVSAKGTGPEFASKRAIPFQQAPIEKEFERTRLETLWIFDADYSDLEGDNAGWTVWDRSGTLATENYWHHDTIRIGAYAHLGDSTWWCGTENPCWRQPRGYGNDWLQVLERNFPEIEANTDPGDELYLDWDQRFAMEHDYDYGYVDVSTDDGDTWTTLHTVNNPGFAGKPGFPMDWDNLTYGHVHLDMSTYAGQAIDLRFRFESDGGYSPEDEPNNPPTNSVEDGAWQTDNITLSGGTPAVEFWVDDAESGNMGWVHDDVVASGQIGVVWWRGQFGLDFVTGRDFTCQDRPVGTWMYAPVDPVFSRMVDAEYTWLMSPPIDISGAPKLVAHWDQWADMTEPSGDLHNVYVASDDDYDCVTDPGGFVDEEQGWWFASPFWYNEVDDWDAFAGNDWLAILWAVWNDTTDANGEHWAGLIMNRQRLGIPSGDAGTQWEHRNWDDLNDWFVDDLVEALLDSAIIKIKDDDGILSATVMASNDGGASWHANACRRQDPGDPENDWWIGAPNASLMTAGSVIRYYFEATDGVGNIATDPEGAPDETYEMTILPVLGTVSNPGLLLVDKHGRRTPGEERNYRHSSEYYYREMLEILGYEYDKYDVEVPSGSSLSDGPDTSGMKYYDTQIWFTNDFDARTLNPSDQRSLIQWLNQSSAGKERNLLVTGNDIGYELTETGSETLAFYETWLASDYVENSVGSVLVDSVPGLEDHAGDYSFMTHADDECILRGACPTLNHFDVVQPTAGIVGVETAVDYVRQDNERKPAGVAYTHATYGYQTVNLGFGMEFMMDGTTHGGSGNYYNGGYYHTGLLDRMDLMQNIMDYFGEVAGGSGTGVVDGGSKNALSQAYPNPFNPKTRIAYSVGEAGRAKIEVYNVAGKVVRTLLDTELEAGASGHVIWDGSDDAGERCGSGVYFYRITAPGFVSSRKMLMLK
jgi:hypothetical protein